MAKVVDKKKKVVAAKGDKKVVKKAKAAGGKVSKAFTVEIYTPQIVKLEGVVVSRNKHGVVMQHKRRASSKMMQTHFSAAEVIAVAGDVGGQGTAFLRTSRRSVVRPMTFQGPVHFEAEGFTIKTVSEGNVFVPYHDDIRLEIFAEEE